MLWRLQLSHALESSLRHKHWNTSCVPRYRQRLVPRPYHSSAQAPPKHSETRRWPKPKESVPLANQTSKSFIFWSPSIALRVRYFLFVVSVMASVGKCKDVECLLLGVTCPYWFRFGPHLTKPRATSAQVRTPQKIQEINKGCRSGDFNKFFVWMYLKLMKLIIHEPAAPFSNGPCFLYFTASPTLFTLAVFTNFQKLERHI